MVEPTREVSTVVTLSERRGATQASMTAIAMDRPVGDLSWGTLLRVAAGAQSLGLGVAAVMLGDAEAGAIAVATIVMLVLQRFRGRTGAVLLGLLFADTAFFTGAAALSNLLDRATPQATIGPAALAAIALAGVAASIASVWQGRRAVSPGRSTTTMAFLITAAFAIIAIASVVSTRGAAGGGDALPSQAPLPQAGPHPAAASIQRLEIKGARYSTDALTATSGTVTVAVTNHDLFWHTFTIGELGVDLRVPVGDEKSVTFTAAPGMYTYVCAVPGHASFMHGVLTVP
jgi:plastocyanin